MEEIQYILEGKVVHGKALGRTVGMPTANLCTDSKCIPPCGVYATRVIYNEEVFYGVTNIGTRPSIDEDQTISIETHILDFEGDLYGKNIVLEVCKYIRSTQKFGSLQEVQQQVKIDILQVKEYFSKK